MENKRVRAKVHMLPTEDIENYPLYIHDKGYLIEGKYRVGEPSGTQKHLYFTTDEKIVEGDWVILYYLKGYEIAQMEKGKSFKNSSFINNEIKLDGCKHQKIAASTDKSLGLPQPSQAFIEKYVELGGIDEVDIELKSSDLDYFFGDLKVDPIHNTVTIHSIKDSWSREEMFQLMDNYQNYLIETDRTVKSFEEWFNS